MLGEENTRSATTVRAGILEAVKELGRKQARLIPSLLYRIDISEKQLRDFAQRHPALAFEEVVAQLIVRRILQKVILKKKFSNG